jgi:hypothetical protein
LIIDRKSCGEAPNRHEKKSTGVRAQRLESNVSPSWMNDVLEVILRLGETRSENFGVGPRKHRTWTLKATQRSGACTCRLFSHYGFITNGYNTHLWRLLPPKRVEICNEVVNTDKVSLLCTSLREHFEIRLVQNLLHHTHV